MTIDVGVDAGGFEEHLTECAIGLELGVGFVELELGVFDDLADEGVAVGVHARALEPDDDVPGLDAQWVGGFLEFDDPDAKAGQVVLVGLVEVVHLGGLAADQGASGLFAALADALDDVEEDLLVDLVDGDVVEEEQGLGALDDEVVDIHRDEVDPDGVVLVHLDGEVDLGAHAVGAGDEDGVFVVVFEELLVVVEPEEPGESPGVVDHALPVCPAEQRTDRANELVAFFDAHARIGVGEPLLV